MKTEHYKLSKFFDDGWIIRPTDGSDKRWYFDSFTEAKEWLNYLERTHNQVQ